MCIWYFELLPVWHIIDWKLSIAFIDLALNSVDRLYKCVVVFVCLKTVRILISVFFPLLIQGLLNDHIDAVDFLMDQNNVVSHINPSILGAERRYLHFRSTSGNYFSQHNCLLLFSLSKSNVVFYILQFHLMCRTSLLSPFWTHKIKVL